MSETKSHAKMVLSVEAPPFYKQLLGHSTGSVQMRLIGCQECLIKALTEMLLTNEEFKNIVNKAVRAANEVRTREQN